MDAAARDDYLTYRYIPAPKTIFRSVFKLPPAHSLTLDLAPDAPNRDKPRVERYWSLAYEPKPVIDERGAIEELGAVLTEAVRLRMVADVPLGALLSGGVDSSVIVAIMSGLSNRPVKTFSIGFDDKAFNELPYARLVADRYKTEHHELVVRPDAATVLPTLVRHYGEPFADSSAVPSYYVSKLTREHVTVALNGDGGDECFGGYERYLGMSLAERYQKVPWLVRRGMVAPAAALIPASLPRRSRLRRPSASWRSPPNRHPTGICAGSVTCRRPRKPTCIPPISRPNWASTTPMTGSGNCLAQPRPGRWACWTPPWPWM